MSKINLQELTKYARYSEALQLLAESLKVKEILNLDYESDYSGHVDISALLENGQVWSYKYYYGSCSGCDEWEACNLETEEIRATMLVESTFFDNIDQYNEWLKMKGNK